MYKCENFHIDWELKLRQFVKYEGPNSLYDVIGTSFEGIKIACKNKIIQDHFKKYPVWLECSEIMK